MYRHVGLSGRNEVLEDFEFQKLNFLSIRAD